MTHFPFTLQYCSSSLVGSIPSLAFPRGSSPSSQIPASLQVLGMLGSVLAGKCSGQAQEVPYTHCVQPWRSVLAHDEVHGLVLTMQEGSLPQRAECQVGTVSEPQKGLFSPFHGGSGVVLLCTQPVFLAVPFFQLLLGPVTFLCCRSAAPPVMGPGLKTLLRFCSLYSNFNLRSVSWVLGGVCVCMCICKLAFFFPSLLFFSCFTA